VQAKLVIGPADDRFEREADSVADSVVRGRHAVVEQNLEDIHGAERSEDTETDERELAPTAGQAGARQLVNPGSTSACPSRLACIGTHKPASLKRLFPRTAQGVPGGNRVFEDVVLSTASRIRGGCHQRSRVIGNRGLRR
jgi:hypothetical protein